MQELTQWVQDQGGFISKKIRVGPLPGRGNSVITTDAIKDGELLIRLPRSLLINPVSLKPLAPEDRDILSHTLLAKYVVQNDDPFLRTFPRDFSSFPVQWDDSDLALLPEKYQEKAESQRKQIKEAQEAAGIKDTKKFEWAWLCVNSRCVYWEVGRESAQNMTLAPFVDFMNYDPLEENSVRLVPGVNMDILADKDYEKDEEVLLTYGPHDNGILLCEYGFVADDNPWDSVDCTEDILPMLSEEALEVLKEHKYLNEYTIERHGPSFRTLVALAATQDTGRMLVNYLSGIGEGVQFRATWDKLIPELYRDLYDRFEPNDDYRFEINALYKGYRKILTAETQPEEFTAQIN